MFRKVSKHYARAEKIRKECGNASVMYRAKCHTGIVVSQPTPAAYQAFFKSDRADQYWNQLPRLLGVCMALGLRKGKNAHVSRMLVRFTAQCPSLCRYRLPRARGILPACPDWGLQQTGGTICLYALCHRAGGMRDASTYRARIYKHQAVRWVGEVGSWPYVGMRLASVC